jgi:hypothetical protein
VRFHDRHGHLDYLEAELVARRIVDTPEVIALARAHIGRFWRDDPHVAHALRTWVSLLDLPPQEIAARLPEDSPAGRHLRETRPAFGVTSARRMAELVRRLHAEA